MFLNFQINIEKNGAKDIGSYNNIKYDGPLHQLNGQYKSHNFFLNKKFSEIRIFYGWDFSCKDEMINFIYFYF